MAWAAANGADTPDTRYDVDPADHFAAVRHARSVGLAVVGAYHSHPRSAPEPSERDRAEAWAELVYLIAGPVPDEGWAVRAYCLVDGNFPERTLVIVA
jgi:proteasome lid subunit RPN8/RPN11